MTEFYPRDSGGGQDFEGIPWLGPDGQELPAEAVIDSVVLNYPELPPAPETPIDMYHEAVASNYAALQERLLANPVPTELELRMGAYTEEVQPHVRDAVFLMMEKGYDVGNVLHVGFRGEDRALQGMALLTPLSNTETLLLQEHGIAVEDGQLSFRPANDNNLSNIKATWDWLAAALPDRGQPAGPATFGNAVAFREAARNGTLLDYYLPNGILDPVGVKYVRARDPFADIELLLSPDVAAATRELTFIDQYFELKNRLSRNPLPSDEELNMGAYEEELEPQVRDAVMAMRRKGYNTGSSGFYGKEVDQAMDVATPLDRKSLELLAENQIAVSDTGTIRFKPDNPGDVNGIKKTWDMIADILPDLGHHAEPAQNSSADVFRYAMQTGRYADYMDTWIWQRGALNGAMRPLTVAMLRDGYAFGEDVYEPARRAEAQFMEMERLAQLEKEY